MSTCCFHRTADKQTNKQARLWKRLHIQHEFWSTVFMLSSSHHQIITDYWTVFSSGGTVVSHILDVCDGTKANALSGWRGSELSDGHLLLDERQRRCFWCSWRCVSVVGGCSQTSVPSVGAFTLSSGTNKKIPVKFSCCTLLWAAAPRCRMWRRCDKTCSRRRVCVCEDVCVRDCGASEVGARHGGSHGAPELSRAGLFDLWPLRAERLMGRRSPEEEEDEGFDLKVRKEEAAPSLCSWCILGDLDRPQISWLKTFIVTKLKTKFSLFSSFVFMFK